MGGEGVGIFMMKNPEGYHDSTEGKLIRWAHQSKRWGRGSMMLPMYRIEELQFCKIKKHHKSDALCSIVGFEPTTMPL